MSRTCVVTGVASGIGAAVAELLRSRGDRVIGADLRDADIVADLSTTDGRLQLVREVERLTDGTIDAVVANAGVIHGQAATVIAVNHYGAVATLDGLRPLLARAAAPRAVAMVSAALLDGFEPRLVESCLRGDEADALALVTDEGIDNLTAYASSKRALARWVRARAPLPDWAGAGIALNAVAPGVVRTPMTEPILADPAGAELLHAAMPMPLGGVADPSAMARLVAFLASPDLEAVTGQVLFADAGGECLSRGDDVWGQPG